MWRHFHRFGVTRPSLLLQIVTNTRPIWLATFFAAKNRRGGGGEHFLLSDGPKCFHIRGPISPWFLLWSMANDLVARLLLAANWKWDFHFAFHFDKFLIFLVCTIRLIRFVECPAHIYDPNKGEGNPSELRGCPSIFICFPLSAIADQLISHKCICFEIVPHSADLVTHLWTHSRPINSALFIGRIFFVAGHISKFLKE